MLFVGRKENERCTLKGGKYNDSQDVNFQLAQCRSHLEG